MECVSAHPGMPGPPGGLNWQLFLIEGGGQTGKETGECFFKKGQKKILVSACIGTLRYTLHTIHKLVQTHKARWHQWRPLSRGSCQCPAFILANSYRKEQASPIWFCPKIPSSQCLSRGTEADAIRPLSGLISSADKCLIHGVSAV